MSPLFWVVFVLLVLVALLVLCCIRLADLADERHEQRVPTMTARKRRRLMRARYDLNPAMRRRS